MSDLFHRDVPDEYIREVVQVMQLRSWHTYQVLTKRSERHAGSAQGEPQSCGRCAAHLVGRERRGPQHGLPRIAHLAMHRRGRGSFRSSHCSKTWARST